MQNREKKGRAIVNGAGAAAAGVTCFQDKENAMIVVAKPENHQQQEQNLLLDCN